MAGSNIIQIPKQSARPEKQAAAQEMYLKPTAIRNSHKNAEFFKAAETKTYNYKKPTDATECVEPKYLR